jgi:predicted nucleic acid-binding protein
VTEGAGRSLVLDTSVAVKFYVPEEDKEKAERLLASATAGEIELLAPATLMPEAYNAVWQQHRRGEMSLGEVREVWTRFDTVPVILYATEDLVSRAGEITADTGVIVYDALFLALAEDANTVMITADDKLLRRLENTNFAGLAIHLASFERVL